MFQQIMLLVVKRFCFGLLMDPDGIFFHHGGEVVRLDHASREGIQAVSDDAATQDAAVLQINAFVQHIGVAYDCLTGQAVFFHCICGITPMLQRSVGLTANNGESDQTIFTVVKQCAVIKRCVRTAKGSRQLCFVFGLSLTL